MNTPAKTGAELVARLQACWPPDDAQQIRDRLAAVVAELGITRHHVATVVWLNEGSHTNLTKQVAALLDAAGVEP